MKTQRITALFLILALLFTACLFSSCQTPEPPVEEDPTDAATTEEATTEEATTEEMTTEDETMSLGVQKYGKRPNSATLDQNFRVDSVIVGIQPYAAKYEYFAESFSEVKCVEIRRDYIFPNGRRHLILGLSTTSKTEILQALDLLLTREDIWYATPNYIDEYCIDEPCMTLPSDDIYMNDEGDNWALDKIMMPDAWDYTRGSAAITVGIIDSGIDRSPRLG